jgi:hypothetical protein
MLGLDPWLELEHAGLINQMLFLEHVIGLVAAESDFGGGH